MSEQGFAGLPEHLQPTGITPDFPEHSPDDHRFMDDEEVREAYKEKLRENAALRARVEELEQQVHYLEHGAAFAEEIDIEAQLRSQLDTLQAQLQELQKSKSSIYKDKHAYQWHDEAMANLTAWHEEVDGLKAQLAQAQESIEMLEAEAGYYGAKDVIEQLSEQRSSAQNAAIHAQDIARDALNREHELMVKLQAAQGTIADARGCNERQAQEITECRTTITRLEEALTFSWKYAAEHLQPWPAWTEYGESQREGFHCLGCEGEFISERRTGWIKPTDETFPHSTTCSYLQYKAALTASERGDVERGS